MLLPLIFGNSHMSSDPRLLNAEDQAGLQCTRARTTERRCFHVERVQITDLDTSARRHVINLLQVMPKLTHSGGTSPLNKLRNRKNKAKRLENSLCSLKSMQDQLLWHAAWLGGHMPKKCFLERMLAPRLTLQDPLQRNRFERSG